VRRLSRREAVLAVAAIVVVAIALFASALSPSKARGEGVAGELAELEAIDLLVTSRMDEAERFGRGIALLGLPSAPASTSEEINKLTKGLYQASKKGVTLARVSQAGVQRIPKFRQYDMVVVRADVSSRDVKTLLAFLREVEMLPGLIAINEVVLRAPRKPGMPITGRITVSAFARKAKGKSRRS